MVGLVVGSGSCWSAATLDDPQREGGLTILTPFVAFLWGS